jgi:class 3 adenylate cyclase/tetratricopeptide (TPR) repeat protein
MLTCHACGVPNPAGNRFCGDCGTALAPACPSCGAPTEPGQRFCGSCGHALSGAHPAGPQTVRPAEAVAERRVCSVLFCDLVGFTPFGESRDPEEVRELLSRYFEAARTVIERYGGVVEKFIGDAVMAVWGTPVAAEGDAERAVRAALDLVGAAAELGADAGVDALSARVGVVTGEVAVTLGATHEGMVAGDAVNTAARVQSAAGAGMVLVDAATQRLVSTAIQFDDAGEHTLKGKAEPERLWRAVRVLSGIGGAQRVDGLEAPLTGRDAELRTIKELFHAAAERRVPRLVVVSGPAGVGKSRLGWEFEKYIDGLAAVVLWHRGRCLSYGEGVTFWALAEIVRQRLGIAEEDATETAAAKLAVGLVRFVPDAAEQQYVGVRLARLLGIPFTGDAGTTLVREELFAGWRLFLERLAANDPVVLLIEDAQHADSGLLDFVDHLVDWARDLPIFVLVFGRPELEQGRAGFGTGRNRTTLTLDPLDAASMDSLVDALVPGMAPAARQAITAHAQGIPLFAMETVRSLIDRDVIQPVDEVYRLVGDVGALAVPDSLHALLASRLDALDPDVRKLVADAAVLGSTFPAEALIAVSGRDEQPVRAALAELLRREVLEVSADPLSPDRGTYRFAQEMLRQVAYDTLSRRDRKARHLTVAAHLRATFPGDGDEVMDVVARHYLDALTAVPDDPDVEDVRDRAIGALTRAAERAERTGSLSRAAAGYASAADLVDLSTSTGLDASELRERAAVAAVVGGESNVAIDQATAARSGYLKRGAVRAAARAQIVRGEALRHLGRHAEAREDLNDALRVLRDEPDIDTVRALGQLAAVEVFGGERADAERLTVEALTLGQALDVDPDLLAGPFISRGIWLNQMGRRAESVAYYREAARLAEQGDNGAAWGRALLNLADVLAVDDPESAADVARTAIVHLRRTGDRPRLAGAVLNLAFALLVLGRWDEAVKTVSASVEADGLHDIDLLTVFRAWLAALQGNADSAEALLTGLHDLRASEDPQDKAALASAEAFTEVARGQTQIALRHARAALALTEIIGINGDQLQWAWPLACRAAHDLGDTAGTHALLGLIDAYRPGELAPMLRAERDLVHARLAVAAGTPDVGASFEHAIGALRSMSTPYHLAHGLIDHAEHLSSRGDATGAGLAVAEARDIAARLGCMPLLDRAARTTADSELSAGSPTMG